MLYARKSSRSPCGARSRDEVTFVKLHQFSARETGTEIAASFQRFKRDGSVQGGGILRTGNPAANCMHTPDRSIRERGRSQDEVTLLHPPFASSSRPRETFAAITQLKLEATLLSVLSLKKKRERQKEGERLKIYLWRLIKRRLREADRGMKRLEKTCQRLGGRLMNFNRNRARARARLLFSRSSSCAFGRNHGLKYTGKHMI